VKLKRARMLTSLYHWRKRKNKYQEGGVGLGVRAPSVSNVYHPTMEPLGHSAQVGPGFDKKKKKN